jgi:radical SAM superfamily enzyme YgiQ (UPF0313 family)
LSPILLVAVQEDMDVIGLRHLHQQLLENGWDSRLLFVSREASEGMSDRNGEALREFVSELSPLFAGVSLMSIEFERAVNVTRGMRDAEPSLPVVWGGIHPTITPEDCLDHADYVCTGEADTFVLELAGALSGGEDPRSIGSMAYMRDGQLVRNPILPLVKDLDSLPFPEHMPRNSYVLDDGKVSELDMKLFRRFSRFRGATYSVITSRGCPFSCSYCVNNMLSRLYGPGRVRFRSVDSVVEQLKQSVERYPFIEYVNVQDDCFVARTDEEMQRFCEIYREEVGRPFIIRSIPTYLTETKLDSLKAAGLSWISMGLQSGSDRVCSEVFNRKCRRDDFLKAARMIRSRDIAAFYDIILDNPFESEEERLEGVRALMETPKPFYTEFFSLTFYPGTDIRTRAIDEGLFGEDDYREKDYFVYRKTLTNRLTRLASYMPRGWTEYLLRLYGKGSDSFWFRLNLALATAVSTMLAEPIAYLRVISMAHGKSFGATLRVLPHYFSEGFYRFRNQFRLFQGRRGNR